MLSGLIWPASTSHLDHGDLAGGRHHRVEIARRLAEHKIALGVCLPGVNDRQVGAQRPLHHIFLAVEFTHFLAFGDDRADAGLGEEGRDAGATRADALRQRALRREFQLQLAGQILLGENLVLADIGGDHFFDLPGFQKLAEANAVDASIVGNDSQALNAGFENRVGKNFSNTAETKAAGHDRHVVLKQTGHGATGVRIYLVHGTTGKCRKVTADEYPPAPLNPSHLSAGGERGMSGGR